MRQYSQIPPPDEYHQKMLFLRIRKYIIVHIQERLDISSVAAHFSLSRTSLQRLSHKYAGQSFARCVEEIRLAVATKHLSRRRFVKEAMHAAGYRHRTTFTRAFKKRYGISPGQFRK